VRALALMLVVASPLLALGAEEERAGAAEGRTYAVAAPSAITYRLVHKFHVVEGVSKAIEGRARILPGGGVQAMVRAPVASFDSGNGNRDTDMRTVTDAARYPFVTLKAVGSLPAIASYPAAMDLVLQGELTFHGRTKPLEVPVKVRFETPEKAVVEGAFPVSLEAFEVERPSLLFVKVEDRLDLTAKLTLVAER